MMQNVRNKALAGVTAVMVTLFGFVGAASAEPDPMETALSDGQSTIIGYAPIVIGAIAAVLAAFLGVRLLPRLWKAITSRF